MNVSASGESPIPGPRPPDREREGAEAEQPALLFPSAVEWRWTSRREWAEEIEDLALRLARLPAGTRVGFRWRPRPGPLTYDRALLRAGLTSGPVENGVPEVDLWLGDDAPGVESVSLAEREADPDREAGGALIHGVGPTSVWGPEDRVRAASTVRAALGVPPGERPLAFLSGCPSEPSERAFLEWAVEDDAALVLAGDRDLAGPSFLWSRPTVACLDADRLAGVEAALRAVGGPRRLRRRFRRLGAILLPVGDTPVDEELWRDLDVRLIALPASLP